MEKPISRDKKAAKIHLLNQIKMHAVEGKVH